MSTEIILSYPWWWLPVCAVGGFGLAWILYSRHPFDPEQKGVKWLVWGLFALRGLLLTFIAFLLLSPLIKLSERLLEKPVVVIAVDNSQSVIAGKDSSFLKDKFPGLLDDLRDQLGDYDVRMLLLGERVREGEKPDWTDRISNISEMIGNVEERYENRNLGALVIASDGLYNQGNNPVYQVKSLKAPVYTIALGDTAIKKDALINTVRHNKIAYLGNTFPLICEVEGRQLAGKSTKLTLEKDGKVIFQTSVAFDKQRHNSNIEIRIKAEQVGTNQYTLRLHTMQGEATYRNNVRNVFIEVLDARNKVVIAARAPHPDIGALKHAIENNDNYEAVIYYPSLGQQKPDLQQANLLIMHELPAQNRGNDLMQDIERLSLPVLFINGSLTEHRLFNTVSGGITLQVGRRDDNEVLPAINSEFGLFTMDENTVNTLRKMPPLNSPYASYAAVDPIHTLAYQQIGNVKTKDPLIVFGQTAERKVGVVFGTGLWRWRLYDYELNENHNAFNELISRVVQYLSVKNDKRPFRVNPLKNSFLENERVILEAEVYNESYQLTNEPDVNLVLTDEGGKAYNYTFGRSGNAYYLDAGFLKPGRYSYKATTVQGGKQLNAEGRFIVIPLETELLHTTADHNLLYNLAAANGGKMYYPQNTSALAEELKKREELKPVSYYKTALEDLVNKKWLFAVFVVFLALEWFMRKRNGAY